jgi:hypothetical protein
VAEHQYPKEIELSPEREEAFRVYLHEELINHYMERTDYIDRLIEWQRDYWSEPAIKETTFPFRGAASIIIPLTSIAVETIHARIITTLFTLEDQFVSVKAKSKDWADYATPVERFLNHELLNVMDVYKPLNEVVLEIVKYGTGVTKVEYERIVKYAVREVDGSVHKFPVIQKDGAQIYSVPIGKFLMRFDSKNVESSEWCGEEHSDTYYQIGVKEGSGMFRPGTSEALKGWITRSVAGTVGVERRMQRAQEVLEERTPVWPKWIDWIEWWGSFDIYGDGDQHEVVVYYHRPSQYFMSIRHNWFHDLRRPYDIGVYFPVEHRWTGIGICQQNSDFQAEITAQHRQRIDNGTLANMKMLKINKSSGYGPGEDVFPGKIWLVDSKDDIDVMAMGEINASSFENEQATLIYSQQRTGVNEVVLGMPQVGTPGTATGDLARLQEGNKKFDFVYKGVKRLIKKVITKTALTIQEFGPQDVSYYTQSDGGDLAQHYLRLPAQWITQGLVLDIEPIGSQQNKIIDRQNWTQIGALLTQYIDGVLQLSQVLQNPQLTQMIATKGIGAATEAIRQILESYDIRNIDKMLLLQLDEKASALMQSGQGQNGGMPGGQPGGQPGLNGGGQPQLGGVPGIGGANGQPALPNIEALAAALRGGNPAATGGLSLNGGSP